MQFCSNTPKYGGHIHSICCNTSMKWKELGIEGSELEAEMHNLIWFAKCHRLSLPSKQLILLIAYCSFYLYFFSLDFCFLVEPSPASIHHVGHRFQEGFQLKQGGYADFPAAKISELVEQKSLEVIFSTIFSFVYCYLNKIFVFIHQSLSFPRQLEQRPERVEYFNFVLFSCSLAILMCRTPQLICFSAF